MSDPFTTLRLPPTRVVWQAAGSSAPVGGPYSLLGDSGGLILDFGRELFGGIEITVNSLVGGAEAALKVRFGESVGEVAGRDSYEEEREVVRANSRIQINEVAFRFVRLELLERGVTAELANVEAITHERALEYQGSFHSSDPRLDEIWKVGAWTVHLCMQARLWDGIKRGRTVWAGDLYPAAMVVSNVFGMQSVVEASLDEMRDETVAGEPDIPSWMNGIGAYSLWWILTQRRWYLHHGHRDYLEQQRSYLNRLLVELFQSLDESGREDLICWRFLDWATKDEVDVHPGYQSLMALALQAAGDLCRWLGDDARRNECQACLARVKTAVPPATLSKQANALLVLAGFRDPVETNRTILADDPTADLTPFLAYPVLEARALAGDDEGCLDLVRTYWGGMLDLGATTFWEDFDQDWVANTTRIDEIPVRGQRQFPNGFGRCSRGVRMSLCHAWSCGVTAWLSEHVLGVRPLEPGCRAIEVAPHLGDLTWVEGTVPTPHGIVRVRHVQDAAGQVTSEIEAPQGVEVRSPDGSAPPFPRRA
jgi:alpha-L-rhamnosidase